MRNKRTKKVMSSVKRGSFFHAEAEEDLQAKKGKAALTAMGLLKKKQKALAWDTQAITIEYRGCEDQVEKTG